ncbi:MAG: molybdopterin oxidoreductase family protein [Alphaproteobacteria bacterium]|nr:molybdopterin oxidoreductase family protein [Alphaproteobacteria bacterium]
MGADPRMFRRMAQSLFADEPPRDGTVVGACSHDCPDACALLADVRDGCLVGVRGHAAHPVTAGFLCAKLARAAARVYAPERIMYPMRRDGPKGSGAFRRIGWDEAIAEITGRWRAIIAEDGPLAIVPFFGSGTEGLVQGRLAGRRFFNRLGTLQLIRTVCTKAGRTGYIHTMGDSIMADPMAAEDADMIVLWGVNPASTNVHHLPVVKRARARGAKLAIVNPTQIGGLTNPDLWLRPRPGTDAALALAVMHVIVREGRHDRGFIETFTVGFPALAARLGEYPPERAAAVCDVPSQDIERMARLYGLNPRSFTHVGPGCLRHSNAGATMRALAAVPALTGAWQWPGCGLYFPTSTAFPFDVSVFDGDELRPNPAAGYNMIHLGRLLAEAANPIRALYVFNGNPAVTLYNQHRVRAGLRREDLFTVVHDLRMTDTARHADIVLPATSPFEHADILSSYYRPELVLNRPAIRPLGEARSNLDTFGALAAAMGFAEPCFRRGAEETVAEILAHPGLPLDARDCQALARDGWTPLRIPPPHRRFRPGAPAGERGQIALYAESLAALGRDPLPAFVPPRESREATPDLFARYPLAFLTPSAHSVLNSNFAHEPALRRDEEKPRLWIHPDDAAPRRITDGALVRVRNDRGDCLLWAEVTDRARPGTVVAAGLWWEARYPGGRIPNFTTPDFIADMGGGSAFNSNLVDVEPESAP